MLLLQQNVSMKKIFLFCILKCKRENVWRQSSSTSQAPRCTYTSAAQPRDQSKTKRNFRESLQHFESLFVQKAHHFSLKVGFNRLNRLLLLTFNCFRPEKKQKWAWSKVWGVRTPQLRGFEAAAFSVCSNSKYFFSKRWSALLLSVAQSLEYGLGFRV